MDLHGVRAEVVRLLRAGAHVGLLHAVPARELVGDAVCARCAARVEVRAVGLLTALRNCLFARGALAGLRAPAAMCGAWTVALLVLGAAVLFFSFEFNKRKVGFA